MVSRSFQLADLFELVVEELGDERDSVVATGADTGTVRLTYRELDERADRLAHHLTTLGVSRGDRVGVHLFNGTEFAEALLASFKLGAIPINLNYRYVAEEIRYHLVDAEPRVVVTEPDLAERVEQAADHDSVSLPPALVRRGPEYETALARSSPERPVAERSADDVYLLYTGGTTGFPKGVMWRHEDLFFGVLGGTGNARAGITRVAAPDDIGPWARAGTGLSRRLPLCPMMHGLGQWTFLLTVLSGGTCVLSTDRHFDAASAWQLVDDEGVELMQVIGDALARPLADELRRHGDLYDLSSLRMIGSSGAVLSPAVVADLGELLPDVKVVNRFGASETGPQGRVTQRAGDDAPRLASDGSTLVLDEDFRPLPPGSDQVGLLARTGHIPLGYWGDEAKTARTFPVVDGVRYSVPGDHATIDADGTIRVLGRGSNVINSGGEKIFPEEVESAVKAHPAVFDALAVGVPDERFGQRVAVVVSIRPDHPAPTLGDLTAHCLDHIARYKLPRAVVVVDEVQRTPVGKGDYAWARETATATLD